MKAIKKTIEWIKNKTKNKKVKIVLKIVGALLAMLIAGGIGIGLAFGEKAGDPLTFAKKYFDSYATQNWKTMYDMIDVKESAFVNYKSFEQKMVSEKVYGGYSDYEFGETKEIDGKTHIVVTYVRASNQEQGELDIVLEKQSKKTFLFFSTWKVNIDDWIIDESKVTVPSGITIEFDSNDISGYDKQENENTETYSLGRVFVGEHNYTIKSAYIDSTTTAVDISKDSPDYEIKPEDLSMKADQLEDIKNRGLDIIVSMYASAMEESGTDNILSKVDTGDETKTKMNECYQTLVNAVNQEDGATLLSMNIDKYTSYLFRYGYPLEAEIKVDFECSFTARTGNNFNKLNYYQTVRKKYEGTASGTASVVFRLNGDTWTATDINLECFDYSYQG